MSDTIPARAPSLRQLKKIRAKMIRQVRQNAQNVQLGRNLRVDIGTLSRKLQDMRTSGVPSWVDQPVRETEEWILSNLLVPIGNR